MNYECLISILFVEIRWNSFTVSRSTIMLKTAYKQIFIGQFYFISSSIFFAFIRDIVFIFITFIQFCVCVCCIYLFQLQFYAVIFPASCILMTKISSFYYLFYFFSVFSYFRSSVAVVIGPNPLLFGSSDFLKRANVIIYKNFCFK